MNSARNFGSVLSNSAIFDRFNQGHLDIYYNVEICSYGMFGPRATTFLVLGCRSAGKLTSRGPSTTLMAPPGRPQGSGRWTGRRIIVATRECNFPRWWHFKFLPPFPPKLIKRRLTTDHRPQTRARGGERRRLWTAAWGQNDRGRWPRERDRMSSRVIAVGPQNYGDSSGRGKKCARKQKYRGDAEHNNQPDRHATNYLGSEGAAMDWKISG